MRLKNLNNFGMDDRSTPVLVVFFCFGFWSLFFTLHRDDRKNCRSPDSRNVCLSPTPVHTEEIMPSNFKNKPKVSLLFATVLLIMMRSRKKHPKTWNGEVLLLLLKVYSLFSSYSCQLKWILSADIGLKEKQRVCLCIFELHCSLGSIFLENSQYCDQCNYAGQACSEATAWFRFVTSVNLWIVKNSNGCFCSSHFFLIFVVFSVPKR